MLMEGTWKGRMKTTLQLLLIDICSFTRKKEWHIPQHLLTQKPQAVPWGDNLKTGASKTIAYTVKKDPETMVKHKYNPRKKKQGLPGTFGNTKELLARTLQI